MTLALSNATRTTHWIRELDPGLEPFVAARKFSALQGLLFLDSSEFHAERGRYSYVMAEPAAWFCGRISDHDYADPFAIAAELIDKRKRDRLRDLPPFQGGVAGFWGYGLNRTLESIAANKHDDLATPDYAIGRYDWVVAFDHLLGKSWLIVQPSRYAHRTGERLLKLLDAEPTPRSEMPPSGRRPIAPRFALPGHPGVFSNFDAAGYRAAVARAVEYIHAGDCFQLNLSQRLHAEVADHPLTIYERLRTRSPAPFSAYFEIGSLRLLSSSPERFLQVDAAGAMSTRPIKGTRPRGTTPAEDAEQVRDLTTNPKDRAENVMIVDLLRNDLGRSAAFGSMSVPKICELETFPFVHHLVSEVCGKLRPGLTAIDALKAAFPGGSITGAPKVRAMELISELEPTARGPYCGSLGWIGFDGAMDTNILIRTMSIRDGIAQFPVGGGIVADSHPQREYEETLHKAVGLLRALQP